FMGGLIKAATKIVPAAYCAITKKC
uniref:Brevinin-1PTa n=1 Tax=Pulchrana picturata TaxID=395594 RepID=BR1A_PULPI|nr:RecName: Full=Brevinin-1PTa [Pulchrana picturata]